MATIRISGVQMFVSMHLEENLEKILHHIEQGGADFLVFPEMSLTGYHGEFSETATRAAWRQIAKACRHAYVTAIIGSGAREDGATYIQSRIYGDHGKPTYYVGEQEDATELETLRMKQRLLLNPLDPDANKFFAVLAEYKSARKQARQLSQ